MQITFDEKIAAHSAEELIRTEHRIRSMEDRLEEVYWTIFRNGSESDVAVAETLRKEKEALSLARAKLRLSDRVLEKATELYRKTENEILDTEAAPVSMGRKKKIWVEPVGEVRGLRILTRNRTPDNRIWHLPIIRFLFPPTGIGAGLVREYFHRLQ